MEYELGHWWAGLGLLHSDTSQPSQQHDFLLSSGLMIMGCQLPVTRHLSFNQSAVSEHFVGLLVVVVVPSDDALLRQEVHDVSVLIITPLMSLHQVDL